MKYSPLFSKILSNLRFPSLKEISSRSYPFIFVFLSIFENGPVNRKYACNLSKSNFLVHNVLMFKLLKIGWCSHIEKMSVWEFKVKIKMKCGICKPDPIRNVSVKYLKNSFVVFVLYLYILVHLIKICLIGMKLRFLN